MSGKDFVRWLELMGWNDAEAMRQLEIGSRHTMMKYKAEGTPRYIALACAALIRGLAPWPS